MLVYVDCLRTKKKQIREGTLDEEPQIRKIRTSVCSPSPLYQCLRKKHNPSSFTPLPVSVSQNCLIYSSVSALSQWEPQRQAWWHLAGRFSVSGLLLLLTVILIWPWVGHLLFQFIPLKWQQFIFVSLWLERARCGRIITEYFAWPLLFDSTHQVRNLPFSEFLRTTAQDLGEGSADVTRDRPSI